MSHYHSRFWRTIVTLISSRFMLHLNTFSAFFRDVRSITPLSVPLRRFRLIVYPVLRSYCVLTCFNLTSHALFLTTFVHSKLQREIFYEIRTAHNRQKKGVSSIFVLDTLIFFQLAISVHWNRGFIICYVV